MDRVYVAYRRWQKDIAPNGDGVIVGADITQQWLLPWWWDHYRRFNAFPVTFVDLGLSEEMKQWCQQRGRLAHLPVADIFVSEKSHVDPSLSQQWEGIYGSRFWPSRQAWFKKPMACLLSAYQRAIWIDVDCEVRGSIETLFPLCDTGGGIALAQEEHESTPGQVGYNSGVIVFKQGISVLEQWADLAFEANEAFAGDQDVLSKIVQEQHIEVTPLPAIYNWSRCWPDHPQVMILHWHGLYGKSYIHHQIQCAQLAELSLMQPHPDPRQSFH